MKAYLIIMFLTGESFAVETVSMRACIAMQSAVVMQDVESVACTESRH